MALNYRFYNGYDKIDTVIPYTKPADDPRDGEQNAYWQLKAEAKSFFEAPGMIDLTRGGAVATNFDRTICAKWSSMGIVLVDDRDEMRLGYPVEKTDKAAKERGDDINQLYLEHLVQEHINYVEEAKSAGRTPMKAQFYVASALKKLGIRDPAETVRNTLSQRTESAEMADLKSQLAALSKKVEARA